MGYEELLKKAKENMPRLDEERGRFEIPEALVSTAGRQTMIKNFADIAKSLRREPKHIAKFLLNELAVPGSVGENGLMLQGKVSKEIISQKIISYAKEFVFCQECGKPDTAIIKSGRLLLIKCEACGARKPSRSIK